LIQEIDHLACQVAVANGGEAEGQARRPALFAPLMQGGGLDIQSADVLGLGVEVGIVAHTTSMNNALPLAFILTVTGATSIPWPDASRLVRDLRRLPEVRSAEYHGAGTSDLVVVQIRDWQLVSQEWLALEGVDVADYLRDVKAVQRDKLAILRQLVRRHGGREMFFEGLTAESAPDFRAAVHMLRAFTAPGKMSPEETALVQFFRIDAGAVAQLLAKGEIDFAWPLENEAAL